MVNKKSDFLEHSPCSNGSLVSAPRTLEQSASDHDCLRTTADRTAESIRPARSEQVIPTPFLGREPRFELGYPPHPPPSFGHICILFDPPLCSSLASAHCDVAVCGEAAGLEGG